MIDLVNARTAVQLAVLTIRRDTPKLEAEYEVLKTATSIQSALKQINSSARLGPARNYQRDVVRTEAIAPSAFKNEIPGYLESGWFRMSAIVNEAHPVTFSLQPRDGPLLLAASAAERLGLTAKDFTEPDRKVEVFGRQLTAHPVKLASLRLGAGVVRNVPALVLPAEAEDLGSQLSSVVLAGYRTVVQPRRMIATVSPYRSE
jgi:hypothetical protein